MMTKSKVVIFFVSIGAFLLLINIYKAHKEASIPLNQKLVSNEKKIFELARDEDQNTKPGLNKLAKEDLRLIQTHQKSPFLPQLYFQLAQIDAVKRDFQTARTVYLKIIEEFPHQSNIDIIALKMIALTYEKEGNEDAALKSYLKIAHDYPQSQEALAVPVYIADSYYRVNRSEEGSNAIKNAEAIYKNILRKDKDTSLINLNARWLLGKIYVQEFEWDQSFATFESILFDYADSPYMRQQISNAVVGSINQVSVTGLKDYNRPIQVYQRFITMYPKNPLDNVLKQSISSLKALQSRTFTLNSSLGSSS